MGSGSSIFFLIIMSIFMIEANIKFKNKRNMSLGHLGMINFSILELRLISLVESGNPNRTLFETLQKEVVVYELLYAGHRSDQLHYLQNLLQKIGTIHNFDSD